ncbi:MAG: NAD(P)-dependent oxidoreductase [Solirubrobacteraceae bacterium]
MTDVAFLGLGIMGSRQAVHLVREGHRLTVYNRTPETARAWADEHGANVAETPREAAAAADIVFSMVVDGDQVTALLLDDPDGAVHGARDGALFVDMSTIAPTQTRAIGERLSARDVRFVDAPVTGSAPKAADGTLTIMAGGASEDIERARPLLDAMGALVVHVGELGQGEMAKVINNSVAAVNAATVAQALLVGKATGVDLDALTQIMGAGSGGSAMLDLKAGPMRAHDFTTLFKLEHMLKDVRLCLQEAQAAGVAFPAAATADEQYAAAMDRGLGGDDFAAVLAVLEDLAGTRL